MKLLYHEGGWQEVQSLQSNAVVKSMYIWLLIVPLLAKLLANIEDDIEVIIFNATFLLDLELPFSWKIFYFSALSFVLSNILYLGFCPRIIKDHQDLNSFRVAGKSKQHLVSYIVMMKSGPEEFYDEVKAETFLSKPRSMSRESKLKYKLNYERVFGSEDRLHETFWAVHSHANTLNEALRGYSIFFSYLGFFLIGIIVVQNFIYVLGLLW